jgi:homoserine dehydrogenase
VKGVFGVVWFFTSPGLFLGLASLRLTLIGFENVGRAFARLLVSNRGLLERHGLEVEIVAVSTAYSGMLTTAGFQYVRLM